jgi:2-oxoglutarate ferredoxin oxidoreductase subunit beta
LVTRLDPKIFDEHSDNTWCAGCGDFAILRALKLALAELGIPPHEALVVSGIGCGSKLPDYMHVNGFMTIHGRPVAVATGAKLANPGLHVIAVGGDGDSYGIGGNHFLHACRRNPNITHIVEDNQIYGLTKGQYSPTSEQGFVTSTSPDGAIELTLNPVAVALAAGATFVGRGFAGDPRHLSALIAEGIQHQGYSLIDVLQPCVTFNRVNTYDFYRSRVYKLEEDYDPGRLQAAQEKAQEWEERIPIGVIYRNEAAPTYEEQVLPLKYGSPLQSVTRLAQSPEPGQYEALKEQFV